jgi:nicotinamidase-related amidase|nr:MAG TPA: cysteine hydrolase [Caudoviricetes sp.]
MKKILVVIDMQNDFITGSLGTKEAQEIVPKVIDKIKEYDKYENSLIYATQDTHYIGYLKTLEGLKLPIEHCIKDTEGWEIQKDILKELKERKACISEKITFGDINLAENFSGLNCVNHDVEIELIGLCTDICVISNALTIKAYVPEVKIIVDASCCAGVTPQSHKNALEAMKMCQVEIINE